MEALRILILEDSYTDAELILRLLKKVKPESELHVAVNKNEFLKALDEFSPDVILSDNSLPQFSASEALTIVRQRSKDLPFILVTGTVSDEFAADIMKRGADDYILKDRMLRLPVAIDAALKQKNLEKEKLDAASKLVQSEEKYRTIFFKSPLPKWIYDAETLRFLEVNEAAIRHYGYSLNEFLNMTIKDIRPKEDIEALLLDVKKINLRSDAQQGIWRHLKKNGEVILVQTTAHSLDYGNRKVRMVIANDITEKIAAEEELSRNELRFRTLTSNAPVGIFQTDAKGKTIYVNETWMKFTGLTFDEAMGDGWRQALHPDDREKQIEQWQIKSQGGLESSSEFRLLDKNGYTRWVIGKATPLFDKNRQITGYIGTLSDITEIKKAEEAIQKSEEQYRDLVENITDLICTHDLNGRILSVNRAAEKLIGYKFSLAENFNIKDILVTDKKNEFDLYIDAIKNEGRAKGLMKVKTFKGQIRIWEYNNSLKTEGVDEPIVRGYARDITESKKAEEELRKSNERFKYAAKATSDIIWELNFETKQYFVHEGSEKLFGNKRDLDWETGVEGKYILDEDRERVKKSFREARKNTDCELWTDEYRVWGTENNVLNIINHAIFIRDRKRKAVRAIGAITDITEKKKLETKLLEQQKQEQVRITATALEAQERERNAIGVELHDNVNQILVGTKLLLSTIKDDFERGKTMIGLCMKNLQDAIDENRKIAHALVTPDLDTDTLPEQLKRLTTSMFKAAGIESYIDIINYNSAFINRERKIAIYRIAQEQCTNIVKYANAGKVTITIANDDKIFKMAIADNGVGIVKGTKTKGIGLSNINSRLSIFNGKANIITAPGSGFTLEIEIPL